MANSPTTSLRMRMSRASRIRCDFLHSTSAAGRV
ncbi:ORFL169C [Human betaherpesvirus 5]|nr:ORFL169C [Human betaherpesvirus 5]QHX40510.1 ORFL169C [Human betaherpesvirus 5]